jgi:hypothetical protein
MATTSNDLQLHDHSGIRWLAPMMTGLFVVLIGITMMLIYPYVSG